LPILAAGCLKTHHLFVARSARVDSARYVNYNLPNMGFLKALGLSFFGFILFLALIILAPAFLVNSTVLNPDFIGAEIDKIEVAEIVRDVLREQAMDEGLPSELETAVVDTIDEIEPVVKEQLRSVIGSVGEYLRGKKDDPELSRVLGDTFLNSTFVGAVLDKVEIAEIAEQAITEDLPAEFAGAVTSTIARHEAELEAHVTAASEPVFAYILGETGRVDLASILRNTVLSTDFVITLLDELDISALSSEFLQDMLTDLIPEDVDIPPERLEEAIDALEPTIKAAMISAVDPILDYLLGESQRLRVEVSLEDARDDLRQVLRDAFLDSPPADWDQLPQAERDRLMEEFLDEAIGALPSSLEIDETFFPEEISANVRSGLADAEAALADVKSSIAEGLAEAEETLADARAYVGYFLSGYAALLAVIAVCALAIVALHRQMKGATRQLGITALLCGGIQLAAVLVGRSLGVDLIAEQMVGGDIPQAMQGLPEMLLTDLTAPLLTLSIGLIVGGVVLIATSVIYPRLRPGASELEE